MASFTAKDVQELRQKSGCGMMDCKKALTEAEGNIEKAMELLREKGLSAAAKKAGRIAAEGIVHAYVDNEKKVGAMVEVNSETDFVAKNESFIAFALSVAKTVANENPKDVDELLKLKMADSDMTVEEALNDRILVIGENLKIRRFVRLTGNITTYIHGASNAESGGNIGVMIVTEADDSIVAKPEFKAFAKDVAMQIAAITPLYISKEDVPADVVEKEKEVLTAQAINEGKPANIAEKMVMGRIGKFFKDICLLEQAFVKNGDINVATYVENTGKELGGNIKILEFVRYEKGEGLEKREDDFANEVAGMMK